MAEITKRVIPPDTWKRERDRIVARAKRGLHLTQTNPGPDARKLRYDYVLTRAELGVLVESIMRDTERLTVWEILKQAREKA